MEYVKFFNEVVLEIDKGIDQVILMTFQARLVNPNLIFSLGTSTINDRPAVQSPEVCEWGRCLGHQEPNKQTKEGRED